MNVKVLASILLLVVALPATTVYAAPSDSTDALNADETSFAQAEATDVAEATGESSEDDSNAESTDYTRLYVDSSHQHPQLKPGETGTFNVTVKNAEDDTVTVDPHLYVPPVGGHETQIQESWLSIEGDTTLEADEEQRFTVTVTVPEDAKIGYYSGQIAFTNETVPYPGRPARPVHAASVNVEVWQEPTVTILSNEYIRGQIEAGDSLTRQIVVKNDGERAIPVNPQLANQRNVRHGGSTSSVDPSWVDIDAPNRIESGEVGTITITVSPPESVENGQFRGEIDLGLKDPARREQSNYWQQVSMNLEVWSQPDEPFHTSFTVDEDTENASLTLSPRSSHYMSGSDTQTSFDVVFVSPSNERIDANRVRVTDRGFVDLSEQSRGSAVTKQGEYSVNGASKEFVYRVDDPEAGEWTVKIMPKNTIGFNYEIVRNETPDETNASA